MATKSLDQIMRELDSSYKGSRNVIKQRQQALPGQFQSELQGLEAQQQQAFGGIMDAARRRGLGFSGIPISEQAQYNASEFMPAVARLKGQQHETSLSLEDSLNQLGREQRTQAQSIYDAHRQRQLQQQQLQEQRRQFQEDLAFRREQLRQQRELAEMQAASSGGGGGGGSAGAGAYLASGGGGGGGAGASSGGGSSGATYGFKGNGGSSGFWFKDANGNNISAARYAQLTGTPLVSLINKMAGAGDQGARSVMSGPGVNTRSPNYRRWFAWDM